MYHYSEQRAKYNDAIRLNQEACLSLKPLHEDLAELSPSYDGIVYFAKDRWHENNASAVATVQPDSTNAERFAFYKEKIANHRVDLGATALGYGLSLSEPQLLKSRMNPGHHTTWAHRVEVDDTLTGGLQVAFNSAYGEVPSSTNDIDKIWKKHENTVTEVGYEFNKLSLQTASIGDTLELLAPATPNAYIVSWDLRDSTALALGKYGALRNYLLDAKNQFKKQSEGLNSHVHDTGDGQDIAIFLPDISDNFDRASLNSVGRFGKGSVLPLVNNLLEAHSEITKSYQDINPNINIAVGLGYVEHDRFDGRTSQAYWKNATILKNHPAQPLTFTDEASSALFQ